MPRTLPSAIVCPVCKGPLHRPREDALACERCRSAFPVEHGIPVLFSPDTAPCVRSFDLRLKSSAESTRTVFLHRRAEAGLFSSPRTFYVLYPLLLGSILARFSWGAAAIVALFLFDWVVQRWRRHSIFRRFRENPVRLRSLADFEAVDQLYRGQGRDQPTMADYSRLAWESGKSRFREDHWRPQVAERYLEILRVYRDRPRPPKVVVDVGSNDGQACHEFGLGRDATFIGIDASGLLLGRFQENLPDKTAVQADGSCLPLGDETADFLFCTETLEHLTDPDQAMAEFVRVLRPGGCLVIQSPNAHRLTSLNPFTLAVLCLSLLSDRVLQKKVVHENIWHNASTHHWDFSVQDYRRFLRGKPVRILELRSREFFCPQVLLHGRVEAFRHKERLFRSLPLFRYFGGDLVLVAEKREAGVSRVRRGVTDGEGAREKELEEAVADGLPT